MTTEEEILFHGRKFDVVRQVKLAQDGSRHVRETVRHPGAVTIIPWIEPGRVCLIRNFRTAVGKRLIELPAGTLDHDEDPLETAKRELKEETGYAAGGIRKLCDFYLSPGILDEQMHLFLATELAPGRMALEPGEEIETFEVSWPEAVAMVEEGKIEDAKTIAGILLYDRLRAVNAEKNAAR